MISSIFCLCGATIEKNSKFCSICGRQIGANKGIDANTIQVLTSKMTVELINLLISKLSRNKRWDAFYDIGSLYERLIVSIAIDFGYELNGLAFLYKFIEVVLKVPGYRMLRTLSSAEISLYGKKEEWECVLPANVGEVVTERNVLEFTEVLSTFAVGCFRRLSTEQQKDLVSSFPKKIAPQEIIDVIEQWAMSDSKENIDKAPKTPEEEKEVNAPPNQPKDPMPDQPDNPIPKDSPIPQVNAYRQAVGEVEKEGESVEKAKKEFELAKEAYEQAKEKFQQEKGKFEQLAQEKLEQPRRELEKLIAATSDIATLHHIWQFSIDDNKAVKSQLKELYKDRIPADAAPWFKVRNQKKGNATYQYLQIGWSRTVDTDPEGEPIREEGEIHLGSLSKFVLTNSSREPQI